MEEMKMEKLEMGMEKEEKIEGNFYSDGKCEIIDSEANADWIIPELKGHSNVMFIKMKIPRIDSSNINGDVLTIDGVKDRLDRIKYQPVNLASGLKKHNKTNPIGVTYNAELDSNDLIVYSIIWKNYFPRESKIIEDNRHNLGVSWEIEAHKEGLEYIYASKRNYKARIIKDKYDISGFSILLSENAAYKDSKIEDIVAEGNIIDFEKECIVNEAVKIKQENPDYSIEKCLGLSIDRNKYYFMEVADRSKSEPEELVNELVSEINKRTKMLDEVKDIIEKLVASLESEGTEVQSLIFDKKLFTIKEAKKWLREHNFKYGKIDETEETYRFRQEEPDKYIRFRTMEFDKGIKAVIGIKKIQAKGGDMSMEQKELESKIAELEREILKLKEEKEKLESRIMELEKENTDLKSKKEELESAIRKSIGRERMNIFAEKVAVDDMDKESLVDVFASMTEEQFKIAMLGLKDKNDTKIIVSSEKKGITSEEMVSKYYCNILPK